MSNSDSHPPVRHRAPVPIDQCPMAAAVEVFGDRWSMLILREAFYGVVRHADFREDLSVPRSVLTDRLGKLVRDGLLEKTEYREQGARARHAYGLTKKGRALAVTFIAMTEWGVAYRLDGQSPVDIIDRESGQALRVALVDEDGKEQPLSRIALKVKDRG
jgi:DNA-binding HxlR family transcriptional regulator